jgi:Tellurite resistance protein
MGMGALLVVGGAGANFALPLATGAYRIAFSGVAAAGVGLVVKGLIDWRRARARVARPDAVAASAVSAGGNDETSIDDRMAIRGMAYIAAVDEVLEDGEVYMIQTVSQRLLGDFVSTGKIREVFTAMKTHDFVAELNRVKARMTPSGCEGVVRSAILCALADGEMSPHEEKAIVEIANLLGVGDERLQDCVNEAHAIHAELIRAQDGAMAA